MTPCESPFEIVLDWMKSSCLSPDGKLNTRLWNEIILYLKWKEVVGFEISSCCSPKEIKFPDEVHKYHFGVAKFGTLYIVPSFGTHAVELHYLRDAIISKISVYFGYKFIKTIYASSSVNGIDNSNIINAFLRSAINNPEILKKFLMKFKSNLQSYVD